MLCPRPGIGMFKSIFFWMSGSGHTGRDPIV
jgi:hypothetical protein